MEKKTGKNVSSGAKKVETIEEKVPSIDKAPSTVRKKRTAEAVKKEKQAADRRVDAAKARAEEKTERLEKKAELKKRKLEKKAEIKAKKLEHKQEKLEKKAQIKAKKLEKKAERAARREVLLSESKAEKRKRAEREKRERLAAKREKREARERAREKKTEARKAAHARKAEEKRRAARSKKSGAGGWIAAVSVLGAACLALATVVTAGALRMNSMDLAAESGYRAALYEMVSSSEGLENSLNKLRVATGREEQRELFTEVLLDSAMMESALEKFPVDQATGADISGFVNQTGAFARTMLEKLAAGEKLTQREMTAVESLYEVNAGLSRELNDLATHLSRKDLRAFTAGREGKVSERITGMTESAKEKFAVTDAPFAERGNVGTNRLSVLEEVTPAQAEERVREYLKNYRIAEVKYTGETLAPDIACYNFVLTDEDGNEIFAEITKNGGKLAFFDTYEECTDKNFTLAECDALASEFLGGLGYGDLEAVWLSDGGMIANLTYVSCEDGVRAYPDTVRVRVCESKGRVVGVDMKAYLLNHASRDYGGQISRDAAEEALSPRLAAKACNLALISLRGEETLCYEFLCACGEEEFLSYVDAKSGEEVALYRVRESAQGSYLE